MKRIRLLTLLIIVLSLLALTACGGEELSDAPRAPFVEYETLTLKWDEVPGASIYTVRITDEGGDERLAESSRNYYSLASLHPGDYTLSVSADGSEFSSPVSFRRDAETGLLFKLTPDGYEVTGKGDASGKIVIPEVYRNRPVVSIGENAFFNESELTEVVLPEGIRSIGAFAFANCSYLEAVNLPEALSTLGESAFSGCRMLTGELTLPSSLTEIPKGAFAYCSGIESISFGGRLRTIGDNAFTDMSSLTAISLPKSLESIGGFAFAACSSVTEVNISEGLTSLGEFAFSKAVSLKSVTLPDTLTVVGKGAFYYCTSLEYIDIGDGVTEVGDSAFLETKVYNSSDTNEIYVDGWFVGLRDTAVASVYIKDGTVGIANGAMYANRYVTAMELPESVRFIGSNAFAVSNLVSIVMGSGVESIGDSAFLYCEGLIDAVLGSFDYDNGRIKESSLRTIGNYAFMNCTKLSKIEIPPSVADIGSYAFRNTDMYNSAMSGAVYAGNWIVDFNKTITEEVEVADGTVGIARYAFLGCTDLRSIKIDNSVKVIGRGAFYNCTSLERVVFPDTLNRIEDYCFYGCSSLISITLPPMLREIGRSAFYMCGTAARSAYDTDNDLLEIPAGVVYIGDFAFFGSGWRGAESIDGVTETAGIEVVVMGDRVEYIGKYAFREFASLKRVVVGGAAVIGDGAFYGCSALEEVSVSASLRKIGDKAFCKCSALTRASFPDTLTDVGDYSFYMCDSLADLTLGSALQSIGDYALCGCTSLSSISLSVCLENIGTGAFWGCDGLNSLILPETVKSVGAHAFYSCDRLTLYLDGGIDSSGFDTDWNSTYLPVVRGCEISADGSLLSVTGGSPTVENLFRDTEISPPEKAGYSFLGWTANPKSLVAEHGADYISALSSGKTVYAVFAPATENE